ncbi:MULTISPECIES: SIR2 family protein [Achromobacter]|uniref:SIR2 family protein n=1 Tax=Achromobacter TaxID=222 RepID=UPI0025C47037|nr:MULTISPECIES: SIR2 family protein [Achromobacter]
MPIELRELVEQLTPSNTVLLFGAGASMPSGAPSVTDLIHEISKEFNIEPDGLSLAEIAAVAEMKRNRSDLITLLRKLFKGLKAKGSLLNLPRHEWKSIYTTNYDELVEDAYRRAERSLQVFASDFDFKVQPDPIATKYFKIHGTISKDSVDGMVFNMILTQMDYDATAEYREALYTRLKADMNPGSQVVVIGQSLNDAHLRDLAEKVIATNQKVGAGGRIFFLLYEKNDNRALLYEQRGLRVAFGSLDTFMSEMDAKAPATVTVYRDTGSPLDTFQSLRPLTLDVGDEVDTGHPNASGIFNGWPARYPDIAGGLTFDRSCVDDVVKFIDEGGGIACLLGASGVGKTTAARQVMLRLKGRGYFAWEHKADFPLQSNQWVQVAKRLAANGKKGAIFVDDAHNHLYELNNLIDELVANGLKNLHVVCAAARNHWAPRIKTPHIYKFGLEFNLSRLNNNEIDRLLHLVNTNSELQQLVETGFSGFSRAERRRRLVQRCEADMFVCLKNVFASEKFDDIILREFSDLDTNYSDVYRYVAAMESAGIRVHRQLVIRLLGISADAIPSILSGLVGIVSEYEINVKEGIYGWKVRHDVIAAIIARYKFYELEQQIELFSRVIDNISPTYDIEVRTIRELCNIETGLPRISDKNVQNNLLRRMMSIAPGERVPRHRLIRNLIALGEFEKAETEIRIYQKDFRREAPIDRYKILLLLARATETKGLQLGDRNVILEQARELAATSAERYDGNKHVLGAYCEVGVHAFKLTGSHRIFDEAMSVLRKAESRLGDPDITRMVIRYERRLSAQEISVTESDTDGLVDE